MTPDPENYTVAEMAKVLRTTEAALYGMRTRGVAPPAIRLGKRLLFPRAAYLRWVESRLDQPARPVLRSVR